jgi:hypothetical protein
MACPEIEAAAARLRLLMRLLVLHLRLFERSHLGVVGLCHVTQPSGIRLTAQLLGQFAAQTCLLDAIRGSGDMPLLLLQ